MLLRQRLANDGLTHLGESLVRPLRLKDPMLQHNSHYFP
jgi:hypothetical protein